MELGNIIINQENYILENGNIIKDMGLENIFI